MKGRRIGLWGVTGWVSGAIAGIGPALALCPAALPARVAAIAERPELARARLGMQVETLSGEVLYSREGEHFFVPASALKVLTTKVLTTAAILTQLGPEFTIRTSIYGQTTAGLTTLQVVGRGDPSMERADLTALARQLRQAAVAKVAVLYGDESAFAGSAVNPNWEWEDVQAGYGAPVNALILDRNAMRLQLLPQALGQPLRVEWETPSLASGWAIDNQSTTVAAGEPEFISVGRSLDQPVLRVRGQLIVNTQAETAAVAVPNPGEVFLAALQQASERQDIAVARRQLAAVPMGPDWQELAARQSPPLAALLVPTNQDSNNLYAEALLKQLGQQAGARNDTTAASVAIAQSVLAQLGVPPEQVVMVDGSGLARKNLVTPIALVRALQGMARSPWADRFRASLAEAGVSGTLRYRFRDTPVQGRLWGKSGAISRNFSLVGYLVPPEQAPLVFSIMINNINQPGRVARAVIDELVQDLVQLEPCGDREFP